MAWPSLRPRRSGAPYDLIRLLQDQSRQKRVPMMAPEPPADFVKRPSEFTALKQQLLDSKGDAVAITAALRGAGGYGKTTLARRTIPTFRTPISTASSGPP
jgi:hypothetical protein